MTEPDKDSWNELVQGNISRHGYHITLVFQGCSPRFAYTIGLKEKIGAELVLPGASAFLAADVVRVVNDAAQTLILNGPHSPHLVGSDDLGMFSLHTVDESWERLLLLGALEYFEGKSVSALQIRPEKSNVTIDVPDLSRPWDPVQEPVWQWLKLPWPFLVSSKSTAATNLAALRGERVTEASRWEEDEWELFAGSGPDTVKEDMRVVPLATLVAVDPSLQQVMALEVGKSLWRKAGELEWHNW